MAFLTFNLPALIVFLISVVVGMLMVVVFRYTSNQKAIRAAKDCLKAHLLALRLFQDQILVVLRSYARILLATGRYLRLAFVPLLFVVIPMTILIVQLDHYLGSTPIRSGQAFLVKVRGSNSETLNSLSLQLPDGLRTTAPAVHVPTENELAWRVVATKDGDYQINIEDSGQTLSKTVLVGSGLPRLSQVRYRRSFFERLFLSAEPALPENSSIESIEVLYPSRAIAFAGVEWNWIWLFFILSLAAGFLFKSILGIEI